MLLRDGTPVADEWTYVAEGDALLDGGAPLEGALIVPAAAFPAAKARAAEGARLGAHGAAEGADAEALLAADAAGAELLAVTFPAYNDGRFFSLARRALAAGYGGVLRAAGPLIPDQALFAARVGFSELWIPDDLAERAGVENYAQAARAAAGRYQTGFAETGEDGPVSILAARHRRG